MTSRFFSGVNGTGGPLHDFPFISLWTDGMYTRGGGACNGQSPQMLRLARAPGPGFGTPVFCGSCAILIHGRDQLLGRAEDPVLPEPRQEPRLEPLPPERLATGVFHVHLHPYGAGAKCSGASHVSEAAAHLAQVVVLGDVDAG